MVHFFAELQNNETCFERVQSKTGAKGSGGMAKLITEADVEEMAECLQQMGALTNAQDAARVS